MPSPLHKVPLGLLELFRLKTLGRAPDQFGDTVIPTVDTLEAYGAAELQSAASAPTGAGAINNVGGLFAQAAIANFQWIWAISGQLTLGAAPGTGVTWSVGLSVPGTSSGVTIACGELRTFVAGQAITFGCTLPKVIVARAGSIWFARVNGDAGGADHVLEARALFIPAANLT